MHREIIHDKAFSLLVLSKELAEHTTLDMPYAVISISNSHATRDANIPRGEHCLGVCFVRFDDLAQPTDGFKVMQRQDAKKIVQFVRELKQEAQVFIVHCEAGISRSAGVAAGLAKAFNGNDRKFFQYYRPNMLCYRLVLNEAHPDADKPHFS